MFPFILVTIFHASCCFCSNTIVRLKFSAIKHGDRPTQFTADSTVLGIIGDAPLGGSEDFQNTVTKSPMLADKAAQVLSHERSVSSDELYRAIPPCAQSRPVKVEAVQECRRGSGRHTERISDPEFRVWTLRNSRYVTDFVVCLVMPFGSEWLIGTS